MTAPPYTLAELAARWHCHRATVRSLIRQGKLACLRISPQKILVPAAAVDAYERTVQEGSWPQEGQETPANDGSSSGPRKVGLSASQLGRLTRSAQKPS